MWPVLGTGWTWAGHVRHGKARGCTDVGFEEIKWVQQAVEGVVVRRRANRSGEGGGEGSGKWW